MLWIVVIWVVRRWRLGCERMFVVVAAREGLRVCWYVTTLRRRQRS